ncbi:unnamed protein product [Phytophthora fragariaefolia]|uniref:Unnamed protein product n=1 Tax=Phytophthora fragariaefolia TaxID=1490495 RepID=A0A9W6TKU6_9STRA|nr:unnamed protein product [Phytophthora fragariaefolia]
MPFPDRQDEGNTSAVSKVQHRLFSRFPAMKDVDEASHEDDVCAGSEIVPSATRPAPTSAVGDITEQSRASSTSKKPRISYSTKENCLLMEVVLGDHGLFKGTGSSKTERWVTITERVKGVLEKDIEPESLRREPKKTSDQVELESLMARYVNIKDDENLAKSGRAECRKKKEEEDRFGGIAIRDAAMKGEKRESKRKRVVKTRSDPLAFMKQLSQEAEARRAAEYHDRRQHEEALH